ncbi:hypothetical protein [Nonomuraea sp. NPDC050540]|uniref:hypothetical protein n=1 Tax=Nonomuraea sp. NPDC050540 TaxID=3364367 RepID=UPI00378C3D32
MSDSISDFDLEFDGEILTPRTNQSVYRQIYALEVWFRRICLAAWMGHYGASWCQTINPPLRRALESRVRRSRQRLYLGAESHDDLVWQATHGELIQMLVAEPVAPSVQALTGADSAFLRIKLDEVREIRNLLAHNRALSQRTHVILSGLLASLEEAVDTFKINILYRDPDPDTFSGLLPGRRAPFQGFTARFGEFTEHVCLPVPPFGKWPDAERLLNAFQDSLDGIVAICLNKTGDEYRVLTPTALAEEAQSAILDTFTENRNIWTHVPIEGQSPRFACSPKIWFYENRSPLHKHQF